MTEADRERCARVADEAARACYAEAGPHYSDERVTLWRGRAAEAERIAQSIRALPLTEPKRGDDDADERERKMRRLGITEEDIAMSMPPEPGH